MTSFVRLAVVTALAALAPGLLNAQGAGPAATPPDFTGVYYPAPAGGAAGRGQGGAVPAAGQRGAAPAAGQRQGPPPPPTRSAPTSDGSQGRAPNAPKLAPEYMAKWLVMQKSRMGGSSEFDPVAQCIPQGMPSMMNMLYGMEIQQTKDKITMFGELNDMYRRIFLDGRKPSKKVLDDPTYAGYSTGHWEGDTLVVETVALHPDSLLDIFSPHSGDMTVKERLRFTALGVLEDRITTVDPRALLEPYESVHTYRMASSPNDELREFACAEGLQHAK